jgi:hypothetical protein
MFSDPTILIVSLTHLGDDDKRRMYISFRLSSDFICRESARDTYIHTNVHRACHGWT